MENNLEDSLFEIKSIISDWALKETNNRVKNYGERIENISFVDTELYNIQINERYCRRVFLPEERPYNGEKINPGNIPGLWEYQTEGINKDGNDSLEEELSEQFFNSIKQNKKIMKEHPSFSQCSYAEYRKLFFATNCKKYPLKETYSLEICPDCVGKGMKICTACNGSGKVPCSRCDATGWELNYEGKRIRCRHCSGGKYFVCETCRGAKKIICNLCEGKQKILRGVQLLELFTQQKNSFFYNLIIPDDIQDEFSNYENVFKTIEEIDINNIELNVILSKCELLQNNSKLFDVVKYCIEDSKQKLEENQKINRKVLKIGKVNARFVTYDFHKKTYKLVICGENKDVIYKNSSFQKKQKKNIKDDVNNRDKSEKSKKVAFLLCFFGGCLGFHRYYTGKIFTGLLQMLSCCLFIGFIWEFIDLILILSGKFKDKNGNYLTEWK